MSTPTGMLPFWKMHGIGNDFVVLDCRAHAFALDAAQIRALADRRRGIGCDQLLSIEPARTAGSAFTYGIWNADGSTAAQCGNGARCVAAWLHRQAALPLDLPVQLDSPAGAVTVRVLADGRVAVEMGEPDFDPAASGLRAAHAEDPQRLAMTGADGGSIELALGVVSMGNPHAVVLVEDPDAPGLAALGPALTADSRFTDGVNAGFVQRLARDHLRLRVHERGAGWTLACGTGACAAMAVLRRRGLVDARVQVDLPGGRLQIDWPGPGHPLWMTGPAAFAFEGHWPA